MKNAKVIVCLFALFALGAASGVGITRDVQPSRAAQRGWSEQAWLERRFAEDIQRLKLTPEQQNSLRGQYDGLASDMLALREETAKKVRELFVRKGTEIYRNLTPAQREEYGNLNQERRSRWKQPAS